MDPGNLVVLSGAKRQPFAVGSGQKDNYIGESRETTEPDFLVVVALKRLQPLEKAPTLQSKAKRKPKVESHIARERERERETKTKRRAPKKGAG